MFMVGGVVKHRSESYEDRKRRAGTLRALIRCSVVDREEKQKNLFSSRSRIFLNCLLFTLKKKKQPFTHCFFVSFPDSLFSNYAIHLL